jgi:hypothetical protein
VSVVCVSRRMAGNHIKRLDFVTEMRRVSCKAAAELYRVTRINFVLQRQRHGSDMLSHHGRPGSIPG